VTATAPAAPADARFPCFDGLRALAATAVVAHHAAVATAFSLRTIETPWGSWDVGRYFNHMDVGVSIFFLISGFLLYRPFVAAALDGGAPVGPRVFFRRRLLRIYPAYWVAFVAIALFVGIDMPVGGARSITEYFFLVHLYDWQTVVTQEGTRVVRALGGISQSWTLVVELSFYAFLPLYAWGMRAWRRRRGLTPRAHLRVEAVGLVVLYAVSILWRAWVFWGLPDDSGLRLVAQYWLPAHFDLFAMGMGLAVARAAIDRSLLPARVDQVLGRHDALWWLLALGAFSLVVFGIGLPRSLALVFGGRAYLRQLLYGAVAVFLLLPAVFGAQDRGVVRRALRAAPVAHAGMVSYGVYLWHQAFIKKIHQWGGWEPGPGEPPLAGFRGDFLVHFLGALALSLAVATLSWYAIERPLLRRKDRPLLGRRREAGSPATALRA
jgi:peptidoglycan/LPS O-acetylase OafA/YrhL